MKLIPIGLALQVTRQTSSHYPVSIYALVDPRNECIMYVGKTTGTVAARLRWHLREPTNAAMAKWFAELRLEAKGAHRRPVVYTLERVAREEWEDAERGWIYWCRQRGDLLNIDPGGNYRLLGAPLPIKFGEFQEPVAGPKPKAPGIPWKQIKAENAARTARENAERRKAG